MSWVPEPIRHVLGVKSKISIVYPLNWYICMVKVCKALETYF